MTATQVRLRPRRAVPLVAAPLPRVRALDGIRALAVAAVVAYHLDERAVPGGYLGVDVFFVLSGFLITTLLLAEFEEHGRVALPAFWRRRARRLLPPLLVVLVAVAIATPSAYADVAGRIRGELLAALGQGANWFEAFAGRSYFDQIGRPSPLRHLWSLSVEAQFYLVWPVLGLLALHVGGRRVLGVVASVGAASSFLLMAVLFQPAHDPSRIYYGADTRFGTLLVGAVLAAACPIGGRRRPLSGVPRGVVDLIGLGAMAAVVVLVLGLEGTSAAAYRGGFLVVALLTAMVLTVAVHPDAWLGRLLGLRPLVWVGTRSYAIYLWHWPVFTATRPGLDVDVHGWALLALRLGVTLVLAEATTRGVELALGHARRLDRAWGRRLVLAAGAVVLATGLAGTSATPVSTPVFYVSPTTTLPPTSTTTSTTTTSTTTVPTTTTTTAPTTTTTTASAVPVTTTTVRAPAAVVTTVPLPVTTTVPPPPTTVAASPPPAAGPIKAVAVGESVLLGAGGAVQAALGPGTIIDADIARQPDQVLDALEARRRAGHLRGVTVVVVQLGTNGVVRAKHLDRLAALAAGIPRVVAVTVWVPRPWMDASNAALHAGAARFPWLRLADWHGLAAQHPEWLGADGVHVRREGARHYAALVKAAAVAP